MTIPITSRSRQRIEKTEAVGQDGMVTAMHPLAAEAGIEILRRGGNAADAAVATALAIGVAEPFMSGIGGCGYAVSYDAQSGATTCFDGSARVPSEAHERMFELVDDDVASDGLYGWRATKDDAAETGPRSVVVPGSLKALAKLHEASGTRPWAELFEPAIRLAEDGCDVDEYFFVQSAASASRLRAFEATRTIFLHTDGTAKVPSMHGAPPERFRQADLANTLRIVAKEGPEAFYSGAIARDIVDCVRAGGGALSVDDFTSFEARTLSPLELQYRDAKIATLPDNSGGPTVAAALKILEESDLGALSHSSVTRLDLVAEALRLAFEERFRTRTSGEATHQHTTHLNVVDKDRNIVSLTQTLGARFGSGVTVPGRGIVLNNGFMWFNPEPDHVNSIRPGKLALHAAAPCVFFRDGEPWGTVGSPGGRKIMSAVLQVLLCVIDDRMSMQDAVSAPRIHCESRKSLLVDAHFPSEVHEGLRERGHNVAVIQEGFLSSHFGRPSGIVIDKDRPELRGGVEPYRASMAIGYRRAERIE